MKRSVSYVLAAVLAGAAAVLVTGAASPPSPDEVCLRRLKRLAFLMRMYAEDYDNRLPPVRGAADTRRCLQVYVAGNSPARPWLPEEEADRKGPIFFCPVSKLPYEMNPAAAALEIGWDFAKVKRPDRLVLLRDPKPHSSGLWSVVYLDGHVQRERRTSVPSK